MTAVAPTIKCVTLGDGAVGKTCMLIAYTTSVFPTDYVPTVMDNYERRMLYDDATEVILSLWDTAGDDTGRLRCGGGRYKADVYILCYSVVNRASLRHIKTNFEGVAPIVLVATKTDLRDDSGSGQDNARDCVSTEEGQRMAKEIRAGSFVECSALMQHNVVLVINEVMRVVNPPRRTNKICSLF